MRHGWVTIVRVLAIKHHVLSSTDQTGVSQFVKNANGCSKWMNNCMEWTFGARVVPSCPAQILLAICTLGCYFIRWLCIRMIINHCFTINIFMRPLFFKDDKFTGLYAYMAAVKLLDKIRIFRFQLYNSSNCFITKTTLLSYFVDSLLRDN